MVCIETMLSERFFKHTINHEIYTGLAKGILATLTFYLFLKIYQLLANAGIKEILTGSVEANMYLLEIIIGIIVPICILSVKKCRRELSLRK